MARILPEFKNMCEGEVGVTLAIWAKVPHLICKGMVMTMRSLRSFLLTLGGLTFVAVAALFTASLGLAIAGTVTVLLFGQWLSGMLSGRHEPEPVRVYARARSKPQQQPTSIRVWNDGKGTIIDM
jgi:hypothetical protein